LKLHNHKVTIDPPPSLAPLSLQIQDKDIGTSSPYFIQLIQISSEEKARKAPSSKSGSDLSSSLSILSPVPSNKEEIILDGAEEGNNGGSGNEEEGMANIPSKNGTGMYHQYSSHSYYMNNFSIPVIVKFHHPQIKDIAPQEVIVGGIPIVTSMAPGGSLSFQADLKKLLPKAVQGLTPMKSILKFCGSLLA
jgi:hypothetical protein